MTKTEFIAKVEALRENELFQFTYTWDHLGKEEMDVFELKRMKRYIETDKKEFIVQRADSYSGDFMSVAKFTDKGINLFTYDMMAQKTTFIISYENIDS